MSLLDADGKPIDWRERAQRAESEIEELREQIETSDRIYYAAIHALADAQKTLRQVRSLNEIRDEMNAE